MLAEKEGSLTWLHVQPLACPRDPAWLGVSWQVPRKGLSGAVVVAVQWQPGAGSDSISLLLSLEESTLLSLQAPVCSVVFSALTDPSVQLQLVGIRALTVVGSLQGWCLVSLGEAEGGVTLCWDTRCCMTAGMSLPAAQEQWQHFLPRP